jgi:hypothetical protein
MRTFFKSLTIVLIAFFLIGIHGAHASIASLVLLPSQSSGPDSPASPRRVGLVLNTEGEDVNAIEGVVSIPAPFEIDSVSYGDSVVSVWIDRPAYSASSHTIIFSGIMPAGYAGEKGMILEFVLRSSVATSAHLDIPSMRVLKNDGKGTEAQVTRTPLDISLPEATATSTRPAVRDDTSPEEFTAVVTHDSNLFGGDAALVWAATDKGVGIDRYEVMEVLSGSQDPELNQWHPAESPYQLHDQKLQSEIYVRAIDKAGNFRIIKVGEGEHGAQGPWARVKMFWLIWGVVLLIVIATILNHLQKKRR